jgi:hypothetical protein
MIMQIKNDGWQDFLIKRTDMALLAAEKSKSYIEANRGKTENYDAVMAALPDEAGRNLFQEYIDKDMTNGILDLHCYQAGLLDGIALGMKAAESAGVFDA